MHKENKKKRDNILKTEKKKTFIS